MLTAGVLTGANPANDATYFVFEYRPVLGSTFCAVPVFPAEVYPSRMARRAVPKSTTSSINCFIWAAVIVEMMRRDGAGLKAIVCGPVVLELVMPATIRGGVYTPSF